MSLTHILVIENEEVIRANVVELLEEEGFEVTAAPDGKAGISAALSRLPDLVVCDIMMPVMDGHEVLRALRSYPETAALPFIFLTARAQRSDIREGMRLGADDYLTKPFTRVELLDAIRARLDRRDSMTTILAQSVPPPTPPVGGRPSGLVVRAKSMLAIWDQATRAAQSPMSILLLGETGVGKDVLAHMIHKASPRAEGPFVPLNCAALTETLLESELFGHEKGAFTGAALARAGLFETANGGTVFLDELGELPKTTQAKLLRVLEDRRVMRVGGRTYRDVDIRFIAATNKDLFGEAQADRFRLDLYYRIAGTTLTIPPLRERIDEIETLALGFADMARLQLGRARAPRLSDDALAMLRGYDWPGNVRELRNVIEEAVALSTVDVLTPDHLPARLLDGPASPAAGPATDEILELRERMREVEKKRIIDALDSCGGNQTRAAEILGMSRRTLLHRLDELDLPRPRKKV